MIKVNDLSFAYGKKKVLDHLTLNIKPGRVTTIIGANGCGKSTLFNLMTKNLKFNEGEILLGETAVSKIKLKDFARKVAIVHQYNTAPDDLKVKELISYGRLPHRGHGKRLDLKEEEKSINWAMEVTGTLEYKERTMGELSGGQRQRAFIAMALAQKTEILFLDEPTTYLDIRYQLEILKLIRMLNEVYGLTVVMVLHDINEALSYSDEIIGLSKGKLCVQGNPEEVITEAVLEEIYGTKLTLGQVNGKKVLIY